MVRVSLRKYNSNKDLILLAYSDNTFIVNIKNSGKGEYELKGGNAFFEGITIVPSILSEFKE